MHNLGHFLEKNIPWLNLVLVLLLKWSIVPSRNDLKIYHCLGHQTLLCLIESIFITHRKVICSNMFYVYILPNIIFLEENGLSST